MKQVFREGFSISKVALEMDMFDVELSLCRRMSCLFDWKVFIGYPVDLQVSWPRGEAAKGESQKVLQSCLAERFGFTVEAFRRLPFDRIIPSAGMVSCTSRGASHQSF